MAVTGDVSFDNGGKQIHPYVVALVRWCVSCLWSAATVVLHRIMTAPQVPSITAAKPTHSRAASKDHIHPEPLVQCTVLHQPLIRDVDFVFVHGLYGSLENTWRQGDWRSKYKLEPNKIPLRRPSSIPDACTSSSCVCNTTKPYRQTNSNFCICRIKREDITKKVDEHTKNDEFVKDFSDINKNNEVINEDSDKIMKIDELGNGLNDVNVNITGKVDEHMNKDEFVEGFSDIKKNIKDINDDFRQIMKNDELGNGFSEVNVSIVDNYNMQADFVRKLFDCEAKNCSFGYKNGDDEDLKEKIYKNQEFLDKISEDNKEFLEKPYKNEQSSKENGTVKVKDIENSNTEIQFNKDTQNNDELYSQNTQSNDEIHTKTCEIGCGCICDSCYSSCWPRDWLSKDFPNARIISINYTSDPYLWRPLWVKECKRLRLQERAMQMTSQLLELGVGEKPVVWVGHSKGGLFIKQIYAEAYEAYLKTADHTDQNYAEYASDNVINHKTENVENDKVKLTFEEQYLDYEDSQVISNKNNTIESEQKEMNTKTDEIHCHLLKDDDLYNEVKINKEKKEIMKLDINNTEFENLKVENINKKGIGNKNNNLQNTKNLEETQSLFDNNESIGILEEPIIINELTHKDKKSSDTIEHEKTTVTENYNLENITQILETVLLVTNESKTNEGPETLNEFIKDAYICKQEISVNKKYDEETLYETNNLKNNNNIETKKNIYDEGPQDNESIVANTDNIIKSNDNNNKYDDNFNGIKNTKNVLTNNFKNDEGPQYNESAVSNTDIIIESNDNKNYDKTFKEIANTKNIANNSRNEGLQDNESTVLNTNNIMKPNDNNKKYEDELKQIANLWKNSAGFMFYSVPHRGSALADIKTPLTARSVELLEISKDCALVQSLQARWLRAVGGASGRGQGPAVRSLVETNRTLMAVLWLRIVSVESADAGVGALCGVPLDHREICKPAGRGCVLYTELLRLAHAALGAR